ncbi:MAG: family 78 glycoside hydrolase catalytic domain [Bacteroidales bacterium]
MKNFFPFLLAASILLGCTSERSALTNLTTEYTPTPLGIDVEQPRFGWQMLAPDDARGVVQTGYRIVVTDASGNEVWDTERVDSPEALAIAYGGKALEPATRYNWELTVWDQEQKEHRAGSWFETGLMDPGLEAWDGAQWIGGGDGDLVFFSHYQLIYRIRLGIRLEAGSSKAALVYGANDLRMMDRFKNIHQLENGPNESYFKVELDLGTLAEGGRGPARLHVYRAGYAPEDEPGVPLKTFDIKSSVIHAANAFDEHQLELRSAFGQLTLVLDGQEEFFIKPPQEGVDGDMPSFMRRNPGASVNLNPVGSGGNYIPFGMVCDLGFAMEPGQKARIRNLEVYNDRLPQNTLFAEDLSGSYAGIFAGQIGTEDGAYLLDGGESGLFVTADPSRNAAPMLRTEFETPKKPASARLYVTARGIYEVYLNGEKVGRDHYNPGQTQYNKSHMYQTYDVTGLVRAGENALGAMLSEGWWSGLLSFGSIWNHFGDRQSLLAKLVITYADGSRETVTTGPEDWHFFNDGPIRYSSLDLGEIHDARKEAAIQGWTEPGFDDSGWKPASVVPLEGTTFSGEEREFTGAVTRFDYEDVKLTGQIGNNAGVFTTLTAQSVAEVRPGVYVYDMGQNFVGVPRITLPEGREGDTLVLRVAEILYPDLPESGDNVGMIMTENYRAALCQDLYIMKDGAQVFQPKFTSRGYQYLEITGVEAPLPLHLRRDVKEVAISSVPGLAAKYETSTPGVNQL